MSNRRGQPIARRPVVWLAAAAVAGVIVAGGYALMPKTTPETPPALGMMPDRWFDRPERADWTGWDAPRPAPGPRVRISVAAARVQVIPEARGDIAVALDQAGPAIKVSRHGVDVVVDDGTAPPRKPLFGQAPSPCQKDGVATAAGVKSIAALPLIVVRTPRRVDLTANGALFGDIGPADAVQLVNTGCGTWSVGDTYALRLAQIGDGHIRIGQGGLVVARLQGSGDIDARRVLHRLDVFLHGSGLIHVGRADGPLDAEVWGAGRLEVDQGRAGRANLFKHGAGEIVLKGEAGSLNAETFGKGSIHIGEVSGSVGVSTHGAGEVLYERKKGKAYCRGSDCLKS